MDSDDELTPWEYCRPVRALVTDDRKVTLDVRDLNIELTCPVCLGILRDTVVIMECLHRFCDNCMQKCLRLGKNECPKCRNKVPSRRSLKRDHMFDALIKDIYPDLDEYERNQDKEMEALTRKMNFTSHTQSVLNGASQQGKERRHREPASAAARAGAGAAAAPAPRKRVRTVSAPTELKCFVLSRHPSETELPRLDKEMLRTQSGFKVFHVKKFLSMKMSSSKAVQPDKLTISLGADPADEAKPSSVVLPDSATLASLYNESWSSDGMLVLHYRLA